MIQDLIPITMVLALAHAGLLIPHAPTPNLNRLHSTPGAFGYAAPYDYYTYDPHPRYSFSYNVQEPSTGDFKDHQETRDGDYVQGRYSLIDPDGSRRIVDYTSSPGVGFNAVVRRVFGVAPPYATLPFARAADAARIYAASVNAHLGTPGLSKFYLPSPLPVLPSGNRKVTTTTPVASPLAPKLATPALFYSDKSYLPPSSTDIKQNVSAKAVP